MQKFLTEEQNIPLQHTSVYESNISKTKESMDLKVPRKILSHQAGQKSRQRKKEYVEALQISVKDLDKQVNNYDQQIKKIKESINQVVNSNKQNQNTMSFAELELCVSSEDPNEDKINLLLDMMKFRIGASGNQRQAKIEYYFRQIINMMFPGVHRYLLFCSEQNLDLFQELNIDEFFESQNHQSIDFILPWTKQILNNLQLNDHQKNELLKVRDSLNVKKSFVKKIILDLNNIKQVIKDEGQVYQNEVQRIRKCMRPLQCAQLVLFLQKYKYKRQLGLQHETQLFKSSCWGDKKIKTD